MISAGIAVAILVVLVWLVLLVAGVRGLSRTPVARGQPAPLDVGVTAFMPARNEAEVVEAAAGSVLDQAGLERFVAIDDASSDDTRTRLEALRDARGAGVMTVVAGTGPDPGECGKPAALARAYAAASPKTPWLLFVDADVILAAGAAHGMIVYAKTHGADLVTLLPKLTLGSAIEKIVMPSIGALIVARFPPARVADPDAKTAFANGQVILIRRELYDRVGGHDALKREILEDVRLAERAKAAGGRLAVLDGRDVARTRMYDGWRELREGWTKNLFLLMGSSAARTWAWVVTSLVLGWSGWLALAAAGWPWGVVGLAWVLGCQMTLRRGGSVSPAWAVLAPVGAVVTAGLLVESWWRHLRGAVVWKGRDYVGRGNGA